MGFAFLLVACASQPAVQVPQPVKEWKDARFVASGMTRGRGRIVTDDAFFRMTSKEIQVKGAAGKTTPPDLARPDLRRTFSDSTRVLWAAPPCPALSFRATRALDFDREAARAAQAGRPVDIDAINKKRGQKKLPDMDSCWSEKEPD